MSERDGERIRLTYGVARAFEVATRWAVTLGPDTNVWVQTHPAAVYVDRWQVWSLVDDHEADAIQSPTGALRPYREKNGGEG